MKKVLTKVGKLIGLIMALLFLIPDLAVSQEKETERITPALENWNALKYGMFIHWGDFSSLGGIYNGKKIPRLGEQIQRHAAAPNSEYELTIKDFNPVDFNAEEWVGVAKDAGMKYMVITVKHHNGFCIWDTETTDYDIVDATPFNRDPIKELADACKKAGLGFGIYFSTIDWHYPGSVNREKEGQFSVSETIPDEHHQYSISQLKELCSGRYGDLVQVFFDMGRPTPQQSSDYRNLVKSLQPDCQINGRVMNNMGDFLTMPDNAVPNAPIPQAWEAPSTLYHWSIRELPGWSNEWWNTWGYKSWIPTPPLDMQIEKQLWKMAVIISRGGNFLLNVGPDGLGRIIPYEQRVLSEMSKWIKAHSEAVFGSSPTPFIRNGEIICTKKPGKLFVFLKKEMRGKTLLLPGLQSPISSTYMLSDRERTNIKFEQDNVSRIFLPSLFGDQMIDVLVVEYEGELDVVTPVILPGTDNSFALGLEDAYITGSYDSESYRSLANDTHCNWDIETGKKGRYEVSIDLMSKSASESYVIKVGEEEFPVEVTNHKLKSVVGSVKLGRSEKITISISPEESKRIFDNGYAGFNSLKLDDVKLSLSLQ